MILIIAFSLIKKITCETEGLELGGVSRGTYTWLPINYIGVIWAGNRNGGT